MNKINVGDNKHYHQQKAREETAKKAPENCPVCNQPQDEIIPDKWERRCLFCGTRWHYSTVVIRKRVMIILPPAPPYRE